MDRFGRRLGAVLLAGAGLAAALLLVSGSDQADPQTPSGLPGMPAPFLGVAVLGDGRLTAAIDAYGNVVDLRTPGPAGRALIDNPAERQAAGTVAADTGIQVWVRAEGSMRPIWRADSIRQRYLPGTNVLRTVARFGREQVEVTQAVYGDELAIIEAGDASAVQVRTSGGRNLVTKDPRVIAEAAASDRRWLQRARPLAADAPPWAERLYERSLLVLRALTDRRTGAVAAGARDGWAYVWPRDAGAAALAYAAAGYSAEARRVARFLLRLDLGAGARFLGDGSPVPERGPQGDAAGWTRVAASAAGLRVPAGRIEWRGLPDYQEKESGDHVANAITAGRGSAAEVARSEDSAVAWAVRPFSRPDLHPAVRRTLMRLSANRTRFGITPSVDWPDEDPWSAPTAWTAWSLAALGERQRALALMRALRRSATPAGALPERVDAVTGIPRSTTPLAWSHAFAVLALRELWPSR